MMESFFIFNVLINVVETAILGGVAWMLFENRRNIKTGILLLRRVERNLGLSAFTGEKPRPGS